MAVLAGKRYAVVSCHVERPLDDEVWALFSRLQAGRPGGFAIAALMRPPDPAAGEAEGPWLERAREALSRGPLGHHTHFTGPDHARPRDPAAPGVAERVRREGAWLRERDLRPTLFCGGGWFIDRAVAQAVADLGYADCTATAFRPPYLGRDAPRLTLAGPAWLRLDDGTRLLELPSTHSLGMLAKAVALPALRAPVVHAYFHDTDLVDRRRRATLAVALALLARRRRPTDLDALARAIAGSVPEVPFAEAAEGGAGDGRH